MARVIDYFERQRRTWHGECWVQDELLSAAGCMDTARLAVWNGLLYARRMGRIHDNNVEAMFAAARDQK